MPNGIWSSPKAKPLFKSLAGFALEIGDHLLINGEEVIFKGWVDQSQTAIEVKAIADDSSQIKQVRAREIKSLARSLDSSDKSTQQSPSDSRDTSTEINSDANAPSSSPEESSEFYGRSKQGKSDGRTTDDIFADGKSANSSDSAEKNLNDLDAKTEPIEEEAPEVPQEPEYNAWEVWTYLERQRVKTLKLLNTFQAEWEANRFVREAERSAPPNLKVHYEIRPVLLNDAEINAAYQNNEPKPKSNQSTPEEEDYADAIDVEIIT